MAGHISNLPFWVVSASRDAVIFVESAFQFFGDDLEQICEHPRSLILVTSNLH
jgi:hypothetical protein